MPEKTTVLTEHEEELVSSDPKVVEKAIKSNQDWAFADENANRLPTKKKPKVPAQRLSGDKKLPDVVMPDWTDK